LREAAVVVSGETSGRERCIKQLVLNAGRNAKFRSSRRKAGQFTAKIVMLRKRDSRFLAAGFI